LQSQIFLQIILFFFAIFFIVCPEKYYQQFVVSKKTAYLCNPFLGELNNIKYQIK